MSNEPGNVASSDETTGNEDDFPREEAARLVQASLRPSRFLVVVYVSNLKGDRGEIRQYGVDHPDTVPLLPKDTLTDFMESQLDVDYYGTQTREDFETRLTEALRWLLPDGGVICVPPPDHLLCTRCRVGIRAHRTPDDQELCDSCAMAFTQASGVGTVEIGDGQEASEGVRR